MSNREAKAKVPGLSSSFFALLVMASAPAALRSFDVVGAYLSSLLVYTFAKSSLRVTR
jgi:hypothetical protein